ncbi:MAG TPA: hypothetical protein VGO04_09340 [Ensifer sp.]|jgi:acetoacetate decarboxylase|uniref:hypothetical protein n=1 Tax=Ensifer sp. TaxID=1872086 RepID=UPI002E10923B|nr:hypothetical protein [Ensifer sp.]
MLDAHLLATPKLAMGCTHLEVDLEPLANAMLEGAWLGLAWLQLFERPICDVTRLPMREVVSASHYLGPDA